MSTGTGTHRPPCLYFAILHVLCSPAVRMGLRRLRIYGVLVGAHIDTAAWTLCREWWACMCRRHAIDQCGAQLHQAAPGQCCMQHALYCGVLRAPCLVCTLEKCLPQQRHRMCAVPYMLYQVRKQHAKRAG